MGQNKVDVILSDMAVPSTGHKQTDHLGISTLGEVTLDIAKEFLMPEGVLVAKVLEGGVRSESQKQQKANFITVKTVKPETSRKDSSEKYIVDPGFRGMQ